MSAIYNIMFLKLRGDRKNLAEIADLVKGQQINSDILQEQGLYYVMNGGMEPSGYYNMFNTPKDTISISEGGNSCGYIQYNPVPFWSGGHCYTLQNLSKEILPRFLYFFLKWKEPEIMKLRIGSGLPNIQKKDLSKVIIIVPNIKIQEGISQKLNTLENKINLVARLI